MTINNENYNHKPILALTAPGQVSDETVEILRKQGILAMVLADGLTIRDEILNGVRTFFICACGSISKKTAKKLRKYVKANLEKQGHQNFRVIVLPDGLWPKVL